MENIHSEPIEVIGKHFETNPDGKFTLESFKEIAKTMEIYSDKHYETARYLFVKDGQILRHIAVSSQTPASTIIKPDDNFLYQLKSYAKQTESKIVFLHNHPSGYVEPSEADINLTSYMQNFFKESSGEDLFAGHIILDHGTYGLYNAESKDWKALINNELEPLSKLSEFLKLQLTKYGMRTKNEDDAISAQSLKQLSDYAKNCDSINMWNTKDWIPSFLMSGNGIVTSLEYINVRELEDYKNLSNKLKTLGRNYGSENIVLLPQHQDQFLSCERFAQLTGKVKEIYFENPDGSYKTSQFRNGNIFNDLTKDEIKVQDTNDNPELVNEKIMFENINKIYKENKIMDNEEKIESDISENVNTAENTVITTKELAEKTTSFVTGNTFSKRNQENIASLLDALRIQDKFLGEETQLISEDQIMMADISIEDFANNMKDIPFAVITVPNEVDEGEEQTFHEEKYYFLDSLPDFFKEKVLDFKSEIQFNQNLRNAKLMPLTEKNIKDFQKIFLDNIEKSKISPEMQRNISNKLTDAIEGTKSENKNVKKDSFKILRTFISAGQIMSSKNSNDGFNAAIHNATSLKDIFEITGNVAYEEYKRGISNIDKFNPELIQQYGELSKLSKILRPEAPFNLNIYDSVINPEGHAYTQIEKETSINNANLSEPEKSYSKTGVPYFTDDGNIFIGPEDMSREDIEDFSKIVDEEAKSNQPKDMSKVIVFDTETTGFEAGEDELLQISITDGNGETIFNSYVKPENKTSWEEAMKVNGITPEMVKDAPTIKELVPELQKIFDNAQMFMSYNGRFDVNFFEAAGLHINKNIPHLDVIKSSAAITKFPMKSKSDKRSIDGYHYPKLVDVAKHFNIDYKAHDSMGDTLATLQVAKNIYGENLEGLTPDILKKYTIDEKSVSQKKEKNTIETNFSSQSNAESKTNTEIDSIKEELQKQFKETIDEMKKQYELQNAKLNEMLKQSDERNKELQNQLDMMREQIKETGVTANESQAVSGNNSIPGPVMQEERSNEKKAANFNLDTAYIANTPVPKFGRIETKTDEFGNEIPTGKIEIIKNAIFERIIINDVDSSKNEIVLSVPLPDGNHREIKMPEKDYNNIIVAENKLREDLKGMSEDSWAWMKAHVDHDKRLLLDENKYRLNTAEDFIHNYKIHCRKHARNPEEAMKIAAWMVKRMTPLDRKRFNKMRDSNRELFDKKLLEEFELASKDKTLDKSDFNFDMSGPNELFAEASPELIELKPGELIPGTKGTKVGTSIPMVLKVKDMFNKKNIEIEKANYKIMKVSKDLYPEDKIILMNEKTKALHCLPLKDVITHIQKIEKQQIKEETKKIKKDHKIYGYEGRS